MEIKLKCGEVYSYHKIKTVTVDSKFIEVEGNFKAKERNKKNKFRRETIKNLKDFFEFLKKYKKRFDLEGKCECGSTRILKVSEGVQYTDINNQKQKKSFKNTGKEFYLCIDCKRKLEELLSIDVVVFY